mmetsp:Transcript_28129/g.33323  ORF Transcript_28129/g.33323 Transcript_28129/m.33323 type:complete len:342 (-) Transcript_28129:249-1274(-)
MASEQEQPKQRCNILNTVQLPINGPKTKKSTKNDDDTSNQQKNTYSIVPIVNDPQHRQLCAVHTINNLLQLPTKNSTTNEEGGSSTRCNKSDATTTRSVLVTGELYTQPKVDFASKTELESIADEMSDRETAWMSGNDEERDMNGKKKTVGSSLWRSLRSNHRTLFTGNFSFSVLETALSKRDVALNWFTIESDTKASHLTHYYSAKEEDSSQVVIGYVINSKKEMNPYSVKSLAKAALAYGSSGRHWFAITKIRVVADASHHDSGSSEGALDGTSSGGDIRSNSGDVIGYDEDKWFIVDSESRNDREMANDVELLEFLREIKTDGGNVFQALTPSLHKVE